MVSFLNPALGQNVKKKMEFVNLKYCSIFLFNEQRNSLIVRGVPRLQFLKRCLPCSPG